MFDFRWSTGFSLTRFAIHTSMDDRNRGRQQPVLQQLTFLLFLRPLILQSHRSIEDETL